MITFIGTPNMLVTLNPPIGTIRHVRFDSNGHFTTDNERLIARFHHRFDSIPAKGEAGKVITDDIELQDQVISEFRCKKCDFTTPNKGLLMAHYRSDHPQREGKV